MSRFDAPVMSAHPKTRPHGVTPYRPFSLFGLGQELENLFQRFFFGSPLGAFANPVVPFTANSNPMVPFTPNYGTPGYVPAIYWGFEVTEEAKEYVIKAELPGFEPRELDIELNENLLIIKAEKEETAQTQHCYCNFYRTLALPFPVEPAKLRAIYRNGVLWLHIPKPEGIKGKHIPIKTE